MRLAVSHGGGVAGQCDLSGTTVNAGVEMAGDGLARQVKALNATSLAWTLI